MTDHRPISAPPSASPRTRKRFALGGHSYPVDRRVEAVRGDLADVRLADRVFAPHYAAAVARSATGRTPLFAVIGGAPLSELLGGESFDVLELSQGFAWGVGRVDGAVGFVAVSALDAPIAASHIVCGDGAGLPIGTRLDADAAARLPSDDVRPLDTPAMDFATLAEALVGVPAMAGGRSGAGVDAAGLVVLVLSLAGIRAPRFVDLQARDLGHAVDAGAPVLRGDLIFGGGGVAIALDDSHAVRVGETAVERVSIDALGPVDVRRRLP